MKIKINYQKSVYNCKAPLFLLIIVIQVFFLSTKSNGQAVTPQVVFQNMITAIDKLQTMRFQLSMKERIRDEYKENKYNTKIQTRPLKVYTYSLMDNVGAEALYVEGSNNNEVMVNPNKFPWINLSLNPQNMILRKGHLFTIQQSGFAYISKVLQHIYVTERVNFLAGLKLLPDTIFDGHLCYKLILEYPEFSWHAYTVKRGETFTTIATKFFLNDYLIMERNGKTNFGDLHEGEKILIPTVFAKKMILAIDKKLLLPVHQVIYDDKGLVANIAFKNLIVNQPIPAVEFTTDYKEYGF